MSGLDWEYLYGELLQSTADQKGMIDYLEERRAALEKENASFRALVEAHEEVKAGLQTENKQLRAALRSWCVSCMALNPGHKCEGCGTNAVLAAKATDE